MVYSRLTRCCSFAQRPSPAGAAIESGSTGALSLVGGSENEFSSWPRRALLPGAALRRCHGRNRGVRSELTRAVRSGSEVHSETPGGTAGDYLPAVWSPKSKCVHVIKRGSAEQMKPRAMQRKSSRIQKATIGTISPASSLPPATTNVSGLNRRMTTRALSERKEKSGALSAPPNAVLPSPQTSSFGHQGIQEKFRSQKPRFKINLLASWLTAHSCVVELG